jgi:hypothetical protein
MASRDSLGVPLAERFVPKPAKSGKVRVGFSPFVVVGGEAVASAAYGMLVREIGHIRKGDEYVIAACVHLRAS